MKRVIYVLELLEDEAEAIVAAATSAPVRFGGMALDEILRISENPTRQTDGTQVSHLISEGVSYQGLKPLRWSLEQ